MFRPRVSQMTVDISIEPGELAVMRSRRGVVEQQILNFKTLKGKRRRGGESKTKVKGQLEDDICESANPSIYCHIKNKRNNELLYRTQISPNFAWLEAEIPMIALCSCDTGRRRRGEKLERRRRHGADVGFLDLRLSTNFRCHRKHNLLHWCQLDCHLDPCGITNTTMRTAATTTSIMTQITSVAPRQLTRLYLTIILLFSCITMNHVSCQQYMSTFSNPFQPPIASPTVLPGRDTGYNLNLSYNLSRFRHGSREANTTDNGSDRCSGESDCGSDYYEQRLIVNKTKNSYIENSLVETPIRAHKVDGNRLGKGSIVPAVIEYDGSLEPAESVMDMNRSVINEDNQKLIKLVMDGLGLCRLPDMKKANISQQEYATKYREYLRRVHERRKRELDSVRMEKEEEPLETPLHMLTIPHDVSESLQQRRRRELRSITGDGAKSRRQRDKSRAKASVILKFPLNIGAGQLQVGEIEEANIRLMLIMSPSLAAKRPGGGAVHSNKTKHNKAFRQPGVMAAPTLHPQKHVINLKVYQLLEKGRRLWLDGRKLEIEFDQSKPDETHSQWLEFDVTKAVEGWLRNRNSNLGLEVKCDNCYRHGARIIDDLSAVHRELDDAGDTAGNKDDANSEDDDEDEYASHRVDENRFDLTPSLNIIGRLGVSHREHRSRQHSSEAAKQLVHHHHTTMTDGRALQKTTADCYKENQRCCRHTMEVVFKEIKGFEFIIQPKVFDAGYCRGRCPPSYKPAHHHAVLQSLIWKQDRKRAPRPCCAPSKLVELEVLHVDEKNSDKLKISTWTDMRVLECACS